MDCVRQQAERQNESHFAFVICETIADKKMLFVASLLAQCMHVIWRHSIDYGKIPQQLIDPLSKPLGMTRKGRKPAQYVDRSNLQQ